MSYYNLKTNKQYYGLRLARTLKLDDHHLCQDQARCHVDPWNCIFELTAAILLRCLDKFSSFSLEALLLLSLHTKIQSKLVDAVKLQQIGTQ